MDNLTPFIENHHLNIVFKQIQKLSYAIDHISDQKVIEALRYSVELAVMSGLRVNTEADKAVIKSFWKLGTQDEFEQYIDEVSKYLIPFPMITDAHIKKLFPKSKKLKFPNLGEQYNANLSYLGWRDVATNKYFIVYSKDNSVVGIEGALSSVNKHNVCSICNTPGSPDDIGYLSIVCKPPAGASPDFYKAVGNYVCLSSDKCNQAITDLGYLEYLAEQANTKWLSLT